MKAPTQLSREILDAPRRRIIRADNSQLIEFIKFAEANGNGGQIELDEGEIERGAKKRLSNAMKQYNPTKRLEWIQGAPERHIWFAIVDIPEGERNGTTTRQPRKKKIVEPEREPVGV